MRIRQAAAHFRPRARLRRPPGPTASTPPPRPALPAPPAGRRPAARPPGAPGHSAAARIRSATRPPPPTSAGIAPAPATRRPAQPAASPRARGRTPVGPSRFRSRPSPGAERVRSENRQPDGAPRRTRPPGSGPGPAPIPSRWSLSLRCLELVERSKDRRGRENCWGPARKAGCPPARRWASPFRPRRGGESARRVPGAQRRCRSVRVPQVPGQRAPRRPRALARTARRPLLAANRLPPPAPAPRHMPRPRCGARSRSNACPPTAACAAVGGCTNRSPITSTASVASVRPTPASTIPKLRLRACSVSSSSIRPSTVSCASSIDVPAGSVTVNVSTGSTRRSSSVGTVSVPAVAPAANGSYPAATAW